MKLQDTLVVNLKLHAYSGRGFRFSIAKALVRLACWIASGPIGDIEIQ